MFNTLPPISHLTDSLNMPIRRHAPPTPVMPPSPYFSQSPQSPGCNGYNYSRRAWVPSAPATSLVPPQLPEPYSLHDSMAPYGASSMHFSLTTLPPPPRPSGMGPPPQYVHEPYHYQAEDDGRRRKRQKQRASGLEPLTSVLKFQDRPEGVKFKEFKESYQQHGKRLFPDSHERFPVTPLEDALRAAPPQVADELSATVYPSIVTKKYSASALGYNRSHLLVYEYPLATQWVIWDYETGYTHLTGLWRAALHEHASHKNKNGVVHVKPNAKADIVKLLESTPQALHPYIKRVRGGFLKIQGTWVPHSLCKRLARSFCYYIRYQLIPIFGPDFPDYCLTPDDPGFGELRFDVCGDASDFSLDMGPAGSDSCPISPTSEPGASFPPYTTAIAPKESESNGSARRSSVSSMYSRSSNEKTNSCSSLSSSSTALSSVGQSASHSPGRPAVKRDDPSRLSYDDMVDIVNASKCLQRLSQGFCNEPMPEQRKSYS